jgi:hypothetical protein
MAQVVATPLCGMGTILIISIMVICNICTIGAPRNMDDAAVRRLDNQCGHHAERTHDHSRDHADGLIHDRARGAQVSIDRDLSRTPQQHALTEVSH